MNARYQLRMIRTSQQDRIRAKNLFVKAADVLVRGEARHTNDASGQEELGMIQWSETIPCVNIDFRGKAMEAEQNEDWSADASLSVWAVRTLKSFVVGPMLNDAGKFEVLRLVLWESTDFLT